MDHIFIYILNLHNYVQLKISRSAYGTNFAYLTFGDHFNHVVTIPNQVNAVDIWIFFVIRM